MEASVSVLDLEVRQQGELTYLGLTLVEESGATWLAALSALPSGELPKIKVNDRLTVAHDERGGRVLRAGQVLPTMYCERPTE